MKRAEKEQLVTELRDKLKSASSLYYTDFTGLNVKRMTELRRRLKRAGIDYVVIKNTLALRAVNESGLVGEKLKGPTGLVVGKDPVTAARLLTEFAKENEDKPGMKGGMLSGKPINNAQLKRMASLPSRERDLEHALAEVRQDLIRQIEDERSRREPRKRRKTRYRTT
jgi:large subunit ribosomal protein L10